VIIRTATAADARSVAKLRLAWADERSDVSESVESYAAALATWIASHEADVVGKLAQRDDGTIVGMGWLAIVDRLPVPARHDRRSGDIQSVFVLPEERSTGLGRRLIESLVAEGRARGLDRIVLHSSVEGADFYRHLGWTGSELLLEFAP